MKYNVKTLHSLFFKKKYQKALMVVEEMLIKNQISPYLLVRKARLIMLQNESDLHDINDVEKILLQAYEINPDDLEVLEELYYFYNVIAQNFTASDKYKNILLKIVLKKTDEIIENEESN